MLPESSGQAQRRNLRADPHAQHEQHHEEPEEKSPAAVCRARRKRFQRLPLGSVENERAMMRRPRVIGSLTASMRVVRRRAARAQSPDPRFWRCSARWLSIPAGSSRLLLSYTRDQSFDATIALMPIAGVPLGRDLRAARGRLGATADIRDFESGRRCPHRAVAHFRQPGANAQGDSRT